MRNTESNDNNKIITLNVLLKHQIENSVVGIESKYPIPSWTLNSVEKKKKHRKRKKDKRKKKSNTNKRKPIDKKFYYLTLDSNAVAPRIFTSYDQTWIIVLRNGRRISLAVFICTILIWLMVHEAWSMEHGTCT